MKRGILLLFLLFLVPLVTGATYCLNSDDGRNTNCCEYSIDLRDDSEEYCVECGHLWDSEYKCCNKPGDNFCLLGGSSCVEGISYRDHCNDGVQNCDESGVDIGGADCRTPCYAPEEDGFCPAMCSADEDIDCCKETVLDEHGNGSFYQTSLDDVYGCCEANDFWCSSDSAGSCVYGTIYENHCSDGIQSCGETGIDCGGSCSRNCGVSNVPDGICSWMLNSYPSAYYIENDPDCCEKTSVNGVWADNRCCWSGKDWCEAGAGSCVGGVYTANHCYDGVLNSFCGDFGAGNFLTTFTSETGVDCGGDDCGLCGYTRISKGSAGDSCRIASDCSDGYCSNITIRYLSDNASGFLSDDDVVQYGSGVCCPFGSSWNVSRCSASS